MLQLGPGTENSILVTLPLSLRASGRGFCRWAPAPQILQKAPWLARVKRPRIRKAPASLHLGPEQDVAAREGMPPRHLRASKGLVRTRRLGMKKRARIPGPDSGEKVGRRARAPTVRNENAKPALWASSGAQKAASEFDPRFCRIANETYTDCRPTKRDILHAFETR